MVPSASCIKILYQVSLKALSESQSTEVISCWPFSIDCLNQHSPILHAESSITSIQWLCGIFGLPMLSLEIHLHIFERFH
jgi:hypothetical protein